MYLNYLYPEHCPTSPLLPSNISFPTFKNYYHPPSPIGEAQMLHRDGATYQWQSIRDHNPHKVTFPFPAASIHQLPPAPWLRVGCWGPLCCPCWIFNCLDLMQVTTITVRARVWWGLPEDRVPQHSSPLSGFSFHSLFLDALGWEVSFALLLQLDTHTAYFQHFHGHESLHDLLPIAIWSLLTEVEGSANLWLKCKYLEGSLDIICGLWHS